MLSPSLAQEIAGDTSAVIGFNVLITDAEGVVIGSGDSSRVGTFHEASVEVIRTKEPATHTAAQAQRLRGVRPGVTLPLVAGGQAVGTVGITGTPAQVRRFGLLVKRQTEILLRESVMLRSRLLAERAAEKLLADIDAVAAQDGLTARAGIGEPAASVAALHDSYQDACEALRLDFRRPDGSPIHPIAELRVHQLLAAMSQPVRRRLLDVTTARLRTQPDWPALRDTITAWCESGFNLVRASAALHIHRNTVVYRMNKIEELTGRPLRDHRTTMALYLACLADQLGGGAGADTGGPPAARSTTSTTATSRDHLPLRNDQQQRPESRSGR